MEVEMDHLTANMADITEFSAQISDTLQDRRQQITKLSGVHSLLKKVAIFSILQSFHFAIIVFELYSEPVWLHWKLLI